MKYFITALFISVFNLILLAQDAVRIGTPYRVVDAASKNYFPIDDNRMVSVKVVGTDVILQSFDTKTLTEISKSTYEDLPRGMTVERIISLNGRLFFFFSAWDKPNHLEQLFVREINAQGKFIGSPRLLLKSSRKITGFFGGISAFSGGSFALSRGAYNTTGKFVIDPSYDKSKLLIKFRLAPNERDDDINHDEIGMYVFDSNINLISGKVLRMPYTESKMDNIDYTVDSKGNVYVMAKVRKDNHIDDKKVNYDYKVELFKYSGSQLSFSKYSVELDGFYINNVLMTEESSGKILCTGFYAKNREDSSPKGMFTFRLNLSGQIENKRFYEIPLSIFNMYVSQRTVKKNEKKAEKDDLAFSNLHLDRVILQPDNSLLLMGEQEYSVTTTYVDGNGRWHTKTTYYNDDIFTAKIDGQGQLLWMRRLAKRQKNVSPSGGGYKYLYDDRNHGHYFLFLDHIDNLHLQANEVPRYHGGAGGYLTAYKIDDHNGQVYKQSICNTKDVHDTKIYQFSPGRMVGTGDGKCILEVYKKKKEDILLEIDLK